MSGPSDQQARAHPLPSPCQPAEACITCDVSRGMRRKASGTGCECLAGWQGAPVRNPDPLAFAFTSGCNCSAAEGRFVGKGGCQQGGLEVAWRLNYLNYLPRCCDLPPVRRKVELTSAAPRPSPACTLVIVAVELCCCSCCCPAQLGLWLQCSTAHESEHCSTGTLCARRQGVQEVRPRHPAQRPGRRL